MPHRRSCPSRPTSSTRRRCTTRLATAMWRGDGGSSGLHRRAGRPRPHRGWSGQATSVPRRDRVRQPPGRASGRRGRLRAGGQAHLLPEGEGGHNAGMATGQEPIRVGSRPPFAVPPERRDPAPRLRGRLVAPVTAWAAWGPPGGAALTSSWSLAAEGEPARLLGLIDPTSAFFEAAQETRAFVVHVLAAGDRALAERFSEVRPPIRGPFERLEVAESPWGPVLGGSRPRAACRLAGARPVGYSELVEGVIEQLELPDLEDPLAYLYGGYRSVRE